MSHSQKREYSELRKDELVQMLEEANRRIEEANRRNNESERRIDEANRRNKELEKSKLIADGKYYSHFTDVWKAKQESFKGANYEEFVRKSFPAFATKNGAIYRITYNNATNERTRVKDDANSARTSHRKPKDKDNIWPCDIFGNGLSEAVDGAVTPNATDNASSGVSESDDEYRQGDAYQYKSSIDFKAPDSEKQCLKVDDDEEDEDGSETQSLKRVVYGEIAHLIPASPLRASLYFDVTRWVFGLTKGIAPELVQKLIHGCGEPNQMKKDGVGDRISHTGLKRFITNKIRLRGQGTFLDNTPNVLIVPVLTLQEVKEWNGEKYEAIVMIDVLPDHVKDYKSIAQGIGMTNEGPIASDVEVEKARKLLAAAVKVLAKSLRETLCWPPNFLTRKHITCLGDLSGSSMALDLSQKVKVPVCHSQNDKNQRVRKVQFVAHDGNEVGHPGPDPMLLLAKGAECWSKFHGEALLAGSGECDDEMTDLSIQAMEEYLRGREERRRNAPMPIKTVVIPQS